MSNRPETRAVENVTERTGPSGRERHPSDPERTSRHSRSHFDNKNLLGDISEVSFGSVFCTGTKESFGFCFNGFKTLMSMTVEWYFIMFCF